MNKFESYSKDISFRNAVWEDGEFLLLLRNDPSAWVQFIQARGVSRKEHFEWFKDILQRKDVEIFIIMDKNLPVGQVRYDITPKETLVSITIGQEHRGKGFGPQALKLTGQKILSQFGVMALKALVKENNKGSLRCFETAGFHRVGKQKNGDEWFIVMEIGKVT